MRKIGGRNKVVAGLLVVTMLIVAGCQAVGGLDLNRMIANALKVTSMEAAETMELKLHLNEELMEDMDEDETELLRMMANVKLELKDVKMQDSTHASFQGRIYFGDKTDIGFEMSMSETLMVMEIEGVKQPLVLDMTGEELINMAGAEVGVGVQSAGETELDEASLTAIGHEIIDQVSGYAIHHLPNPAGLTVKPATESIHGEAVSVMHVQSELKGMDIWDWAKSYVEALSADRKGMEKMLTGIYDIMLQHPELYEAAGEVNPYEQPELDAPTKKETIRETVDEVMDMMESLKEEMELAEEEGEEGELPLDEILTEDTYMKADLYVDSKLDVRKQRIEAAVKPGAELTEGSPLEGVTVIMTSERWNVNGSVQSEAPTKPKEALDLEEMFSMDGRDLLQQADSDSTVYDILKNKLHVGRQSIMLWTDDAHPPILTPSGATLIPLRSTSEQLGAKVTYDKKTRAIKVVDDATATTLSMKIGSDSVLVNGKAQKWAFPVTTINSTTYVSAKDFVKVLGAELQWDEYDEEDYGYVTIEREVE
ncbi:copper amine oxidase N-terminal domain-containing protein [Paenibacillus sp. GCM10023252]|uniref:copper amine oxidase N-terminal domain-containing protein n=1 Tax=Paenibacillus sp. GCM10023252 TaxID=3252649 RepID=UPI0036083123